jgi:hypothetical protein
VKADFTPASPAASTVATSTPAETSEFENGFEDGPLPTHSYTQEGEDWTRSYKGLGTVAFPPEVAEVLLQPLKPEDVEIKPDGIIYLPEIKYRRILNKAFGPGGWGLAPRGETIVTKSSVTREYGLIVQGR